MLLDVKTVDVIIFIIMNLDKKISADILTTINFIVKITDVQVNTIYIQNASFYFINYGCK